MPRGARAGASKSPDMGYKFDCQYCEGEVFQAQQPELVIAIEESGSGKNRSLQSVCYQACVECAIEIKEENKKFAKEMSVRQVTPLRDAAQLAATLPEKPAASGTDAKLDKMLDAIAALTELMARQMHQNVVLQPPSQSQPMVALPATIPQPKRKILAPPVKKNASTTKKPKSTKAAPAKRKSR